MKRLRHFSLISLFGLSLSRIAEASVILFPHERVTAAQLTAVRGVKSVAPVFDGGEAAYLGQAIGQDFSRALKLEVEGHPDLRAYGRVEVNPFAETQTNSEQWALDNNGFSQEIELSDIEVLGVRGRAGEDIGLKGLPTENPERKIKVAVVDTGIDLGHPAFSRTLRTSGPECEAEARYHACMNTIPDKEACHRQFAKIDADGNGYPRDCHGWSVLGAKDVRTGVAGRPDPSDEVGHGTHVSGIIAAQGFVQGAIENVELIPVKVIGSDRGSASTELPVPSGDEFTKITAEADHFARGVLYALRAGAQVINLSLGYSIRDDSTLMRRMVELALSRGVVVVAAAGNQSSRTPVYPCTYAGVLCVASHSSDGSISYFSNYGDAVDIAAPGHGILSTWLRTLYPSVFTERKGYDFKNGTSMSAPYVTAGITRLLNLGYSAREAKARVLAGARPHRLPTGMSDPFPKTTLGGNLDLASAVALPIRPLIRPTQKGPLFLSWDALRSNVLPRSTLRMALKNEWGAAPGPVVVNLGEPKARDGVASVLRIFPRAFQFDGWGENEERVLEVEVTWSDGEEPSAEYQLPVEISGPGFATSRFEKSVEFVVPVGPIERASSLRPGVRVLSSGILDPAALPATSFKPIACADGGYLGIHQEAGTLVLSVLNREKEGGLKPGSSIIKLDTQSERLISFDCLDTDGDSLMEYIVAVADPATKRFSVRYFDRDLRENSERRSGFSTEVAVPSRELVWSTYRGRKVPHFIARGKVPEADLPPVNPWESAADRMRSAENSRLYRVLPGDLVSTSGCLRLVIPVREEEKYLLRQFLGRGESILLFRGEGFLGDFSVIPFVDGTLLPFRESRLAMADYQYLGLLPSVRTSNSWSVFWEASTAGRLRIFALFFDGIVRSYTQPTLRPGDGARELISVDADSGGTVSGFYRSRYYLHAFDQGTGAVRAADTRMHEARTVHVPGVQGTLILPEQAGASLTTEVLQGVATEALSAESPGELRKLARHKTAGVGGCEIIDLVPTDGSRATALRYFCGGQFIEIDL